MDEGLVVFTTGRAATLSGLSMRQLTYWRRTGLVEPRSDTRLSSARPVHLYGFSDMMSLMVIAELKKRDVTLQRIRRIVRGLRRRGYNEPLTQIAFGVSEPEGKRRQKVLVALMLEDGTWEGDTDPGQMLMRETLQLSEIRARLVTGSQRSADAIGRIEQRRGTLGNKPVFEGTRIPVSAVRAFLTRGTPVSEILEAFPTLTEADISAATSQAAI